MNQPNPLTSELIGDLTYINYAHNRGLSPEVSPERWAKVYGPSTPEMELRYRLDAMISGLTGIVERAESMVWAKTGQCEISVPLEITGQFAEICGASASTFCAECKKELCPKHAVKVGMETYCEMCGDEAEAAMLPLLNEAKKVKVFKEQA